MVIAGEHDLAITPEAIRETYLAWNPMAEMEVMPNAGHYPMNETPVALATAIESFLLKG
jgi:esterase